MSRLKIIMDQPEIDSFNPRKKRDCLSSEERGLLNFICQSMRQRFLRIKREILMSLKSRQSLSPTETFDTLLKLKEREQEPLISDLRLES